MECDRAVRKLTTIAWICGLAIGALGVAAHGQEVAPRQSTAGPVAPPEAGPKTVLRMEAEAASRVIAGVPGYAWRHGCGPTAVGMVVGYYDGRGFPDLFSGDASTQTPSVSQELASQGSGTTTTGEQRHYEDYVLPIDSSTLQPDRSETNPAACHRDDSIADFMHTSWSQDGNFYGWSWSNRVRPAFVSYIRLRYPDAITTVTQYQMGSTLTWPAVKREIDADRPMVFLVDTNRDGLTDHFVTVIGYREGAVQEYGCLDTWYPYDEVRWSEFRAMSTTYNWGIWGGWSFDVALPVSAPTRAKAWRWY